jgi:tetratricopeptide (TPR) repeat protein
LRREEGRGAEAEILVTAALRDWQSAWGDTVDLARAHHLFGLTLGDRGAVADAERQLREAERILLAQARLPRLIVEVRADHGRILNAAGRHAEAEETLRAALAEAMRLDPGRERRIHAACRTALGVALLGLARPLDAVETLRSAIAILERMHGAGAPSAAEARTHLARAHLQCGDWTAAEEEGWRALAALRASPDAQPALGLQAGATRAQALLQLGRAAEARTALAEARSAWFAALPADDAVARDFAAVEAAAAQAP